ncbi:MAG: AbrB/MazE/SpoVT family DNA-binding domain-containing protein [Pseudomonadota bacterium]|nr:AbrB/MazE/SpoVT family DNA-binding domain-containing protein [Pseudomonadota bacterium]
MIATLTSKGQLTLPKAIRDQMKLEAGSKLDFKVEADGTLTIRPLTRSIDSLIGMFHRPGVKAASIKEMDEAIGKHVAAEDRRVLRQARARRPAPAKKAA